MKQSNQSVKWDFSYWMDLALNDPEEFESKRTETIYRAIENDPLYAGAHACLASILMQRMINRHGGDPEQDRKQALAAVERAVELAPNDPTVLRTLGNVMAYCGQHRKAVDAFRRAVATAPFDFHSWGRLGRTLAYGGDAGELEIADGKILRRGRHVASWREACAQMQREAISARGRFDGNDSPYSGEGHSQAAQGIDLHSDYVVCSNNVVDHGMMGIKATHGCRNLIISGNMLTHIDLWGILLNPGAGSHRAESAKDDKPPRPANVDGGTIISGNIIADYADGPSVVMMNTLSNHVPSDTMIRGTDGVIMWKSFGAGDAYGIRVVPFAKGKEETVSRLLPLAGPDGTGGDACKASPEGAPAGDEGLPEVEAVQAVEHLLLLLFILRGKELPYEPEVTGQPIGMGEFTALVHLIGAITRQGLSRAGLDAVGAICSQTDPLLPIPCKRQGGGGDHAAEVDTRSEFLVEKGVIKPHLTQTRLHGKVTVGDISPHAFVPFGEINRDS